MDIKTLIGSNTRPEGTNSSAKPRGPSIQPEQSTSKSAAPVGESVTLTPTAKSLKAATERASTVPFDEAKVARIKAAIAEDSYPIDNARLADRMLSAERLLA